MPKWRNLERRFENQLLFAYCIECRGVDSDVTTQFMAEVEPVYTFELFEFVSDFFSSCKE